MFPKNSLVMYKGGGHDGCFWEWNYAYFDATGQFHNIAATGCNGCDTRAKLEKAHQNRPKDFDVYKCDKPAELKRFVKEAPISHLLGCAKWFSENAPQVVLRAGCEQCGRLHNITEMEGGGLHGVGGIAMDYDHLVCVECACEHEDED